ncbi:MAG: radical SAM peptide maturase [Bacteroidales bacterium]
MQKPLDFTTIVTPTVVRHNILNLKNLVFEVTDACNLRCKYCGFADLYEGYDERKNVFLTFEKAKVLIDHLATLWREHKYEDILHPLTIGFYGGEPLLNIEFIKQVSSYIESLTDIGRAIRYNMTTNAMLLDCCMAFLVQKKIDLLISLDGDEKGQSYRVDAQGNNSFERVVRNVKLLQKTHPKYFKEHVNFNAVLHNRNDVETTSRFIEAEFGKKPRIAALNDSSVKPEKKEEFYQTYKNVMQSFLAASNCKQMIAEGDLEMPQVNLLSRYLFNHSGNTFDGYYQLRIDKEKLGLVQTGTCTPFLLKMFMTVNGKILQCEKINHEFALGQVYNDYVDLDFKKNSRYPK